MSLKLQRPKITTKRHRMAEAFVLGRSSSAEDGQSSQEIRRLRYELQIHQIELEMQNEALLKVRAEAESALSQVRELNKSLAAYAAELALARDEASAASRAKSSFLANISHAMRTPLNGILGMAHLLRRNGLTVKQSIQLDTIEQSGRHLLSLANDVLDYSRVQSGKYFFEQVDFTRAELMQGIAALVDNRARDKGLQLDFDLAAIPDLLRGDRVRLTQALVNYVGNAIKFTEQGSIIIKGCLLEESAEDYLLRFEVSDSGIGMTPAQQQLLFKAFPRADKLAIRQSGSNGLGLAITRRIAELMDGEVGVVSELGKGSTFWLSVRLNKGQRPASITQHSHQAPAEAVLRRDFRNTWVLLVEDEQVNQDVIMTMLKDAGFNVDLAENGVEAIGMAKQRNYALILMDIEMPEVDGLQATRAIRRLPGREVTPILSMMAKASSLERDQCLNAGLNDVIAKPVDPAVLFGQILKWLARPGRQPSI